MNKIKHNAENHLSTHQFTYNVHVCIKNYILVHGTGTSNIQRVN